MPKSALWLASILCLTAYCGEIKLQWDPNPDTNVNAYILYYGNGPGTYTNQVKVGNRNNYILTGLPTNWLTYMSVVAQGTNRIESDFSPETVAMAVPIVNKSTNAILISSGANDPAGPWTPIAAVTNPVTQPFQFYRTTLIVTNQ